MDLTKPVSAREIRAASQAMAEAIEQEAQEVGVAAEDRAQQLAPGLATGSNAPGGYNYARFIAPVVDPLTTNFVLQGQQNVLRNTLRDAQHAADQEYEAAQYAYRERQRAYQREQARRNRERRQAAERQAAADRLAAIRQGNQSRISTSGSPNPAVVPRPTTRIPTGTSPVRQQSLSVVSGGGLQGYGNIPENSLLSSRSAPQVPVQTLLQNALRIGLGR